ncbi:SEC, partial [Symbiodinium natans]
MARAFYAALVVLLPTPVAAASPLQQARQDVQEKPSDPVGWEKLGSLLRRDRQWKEAEHSFRKALDLRAPSIQESLSGLGTALFEQERFAEAIAHFRAAVVLSPERPQVHENLALALEEDGQLEEAIQSLRRSLTLAPRNVKARNFLGELLTQATRFREAEETFRESLAIDPNRAETNRQMGDALLLRQAYEEALPHLSKAVQADMDGDQDPWKDLAYTLEFMGRDAEAEELYRLVLQNTSAKPDLLWRISRLAKSRGKPK